MTRPIISAYTPSNTDPDTRRRIFVQRHKLLDRAVRWCEQSIETGDKHHLLFVGPRGSGKTHLVSMIHDRLVANEGLADKVRIAWLGEDNVFTGLIDLALEIADRLAEDYPDELEFDCRRHVQGLDPDQAAEAILGEIIRRLGDRSLLLIMENLDRAFHGLGDTGQKKWRAFLQETGRIATVATSQQLFAGVSSRDAAFFGFFEIIHLEPLAVDDARQLMANIAREHGKADLLQFLQTPEGRYRVRALQHLAGGNHRMYVMLSEFLTKDSLDDLVAAFEQLAEDLTPYFQERLRSLSPQQARIVQTLCAAPGAMSVKEVAAESFIAERNVSKQLGELRQKSYVVSEKRGKESYYEMAEPLMRLCLEVKNQRGKPLRLVAAFLRVWYSRDYVGVSQLSAGSGLRESLAIAAYRSLALQLDMGIQDVIREQLEREFDRCIESNNSDDALSIAEELAVCDGFAGAMGKSRLLYRQGCLREAATELDRALAFRHLEPHQLAAALGRRSIANREMGNVDCAIADSTRVIEMERVSSQWAAVALLSRALSYSSQRDYAKAIADITTLLELEEVPRELVANALGMRGVIYHDQGRSDLAIADCTSALETAEVPWELLSEVLYWRGSAYDSLGVTPQAIADWTRLVDKAETRSRTRNRALFSLSAAMFASRSVGEAISGLHRAFSSGDPGTSEYGGMPRNILAGVLRRTSEDWPAAIEGMVPIYAEYRMLTDLGAGLVKVTDLLDSGDYSASQLDVWNSAWKRSGERYEQLEAPLAVLDAAVRVIKSGDDRPLFELPLEIRRIVRPLLSKTLGEEQPE